MLNSLKTFFFIKKAMEFDKFPIKIIVLLYISEKNHWEWGGAEKVIILHVSAGLWYNRQNILFSPRLYSTPRHERGSNSQR